ncbi:MAG TPA: nitroreductase family protein [Candidatus Omnitrophota bacterium]|nr:nitroreductase family protein [Candidatus Omnitrophota bacterium]
MDGFKLLQERRSVRRFKSKEVSFSILFSIINAARFAPTARNIQPCEFITITDRPSLEKCGELTAPNGSFISGAAAAIVIISKDTKYYLEDGSAATTYCLLAAFELGLGSCWVAGDKKDYAQKILEYLKVPAGYKLISIVALGFADEVPSLAKKMASEVLHVERF